MRKIVVGVDPGISGAIAFLDEGRPQVEDMPIIRDGRLSWVDGKRLSELLAKFTDRSEVRITACVERVGAMPKQGIASAFNFGVGFGSVLSILQAHEIPIRLVTAATWKTALGLRGKPKRASLDKARLLFPSVDLSLAKHEGRAEALLIAHWGAA
jgi:crossover junction endodeoxyribonuclease RuvC